jgi:alkylation response protein AidB-like acyl-CoA dehydrogenase
MANEGDWADEDTGGEGVSDLPAWLGANWHPDLTVGEWWERLGLAGWAAPALPANAYGRDLTRNDAVQVERTIAEFGALGPPGGLGLLLAAPTIATFGTQSQIDRFVKPIVTGQHAWCQLFSEPGAGSDLAGLQTRAERDGEEWIVTGQKVWTSGAQAADMGMLLARTDPNVPKHQGITYFAFDMHQPGLIDIRPLREISGRALFNEVFITDARVHDDARIGDCNGGWAVANATLAFERAGLGAGGGQAAVSAAAPGTVVGDLDRRAGDFVVAEGGERPAEMRSSIDTLVRLATEHGLLDEPTLRQDIMRLHTLAEIGRYGTLRAKAARRGGRPEVPGLGNTAKLSMSSMARLSREVALRLLGAEGTLHAYEPEQAAALDEATGRPINRQVTEMALMSPGPSIYGGTDQIQRNIIGERVLGLPKEPNDDKRVAFRDLPKNG